MGTLRLWPRRARRWTSGLIVAEVTLTLVLLAGAALMMRSFLVLYRMDVGADTSHVLTMRLTLPLAKYPQPQPRVDVYQRIEQRLRADSRVGVPYTDEMIAEGRADFIAQADPNQDATGLQERYPGAQQRDFDRQPGISEMDALIAYLSGSTA